MKPTRVHSLPPDYAASVADRILRRSKLLPTGCIIWTGAIDRNGYGSIKLALNPTRYVGAHRAAWLSMVGPIEGWLVVDHLCRARACVNIDHMELVTNSVNILRGDHSGKKGRSGIRAGGSVCTHGQSDGRWYTDRRGYTRWVCRPCAYRRHAEWKARQLAA